MQRTLSIEHDGETIVSKSFDFETACLVDDVRFQGGKGIMSMCKDAVDYMFEGTKATQAVIEGLDIKTRNELCYQVWDFYMNALMGKNAESQEKDKKTEN